MPLRGAFRVGQGGRGEGEPRAGAPTGRRRRGIAASAAIALTLACAVSGATAAAASAGESEEREQARSLGLEAYEYGQPLLDTERIYKTITSVTVPDHVGDAPANQLSHFTNLVTEREGVVVAPNADTLYSIGWLKLTHQPVVLHVPQATRLNVVELVSPYTENFANIGDGASGMTPPGNYIIAGPSQLSGQEEADGLKVIHSPYSRVWAIARTVVKSEADVPNALAVQEATKLVPLNKWAKEGLSYEPPAPKKIITTEKAYTVPGTQPGENPLKYWKALGKALQAFPPPAADQPLLEQLAAVNIGPGKWPTSSNSSKATLEGLESAVREGPTRVLRDVKTLFEAGFEAHNGWLVGNIGTYGTNYTLRAVADKLGVGALKPNISIYPLALTDRTGAKLTGATRYVAHFPASDFPVPVEAFWSITMYETNGFFVANPLKRYTLGDRSNLQFNLDGSLDIYLQQSEPTTEVERENWLPEPAEGFQLVMRLYGTEEADIPGILAGTPGSWQPPTILPCLPSGKTAAGTACAE